MMAFVNNGVISLVICIVSFCARFVLSDNISLAVEMLKKYNYMGKEHPDLRMRKNDTFVEALRNFQAFAGINETGVLDKATMEKLTSMRCGVPDIIDKGSIMRKRRRRYALAGSKWVGVIGYRIKKYSKTTSLRPPEIRAEIQRALKEWSKHAELKFNEQKENADIEISFERRDHNDGSPFDGRGMVLAHAFFPSRKDIGGDLHFDDDEKWSVGGDKGVDLYFVALHEIGHSLGLQHSSDKEAVMHPYYSGYNPKLTLTQDDIKGIQAIYGSRPSIKLRRPKIPQAPYDKQTETRKKHFCQIGTVDAVGVLNKTLFVFQGEFFVVLNETGIMSGYPRRIQDDWVGLPNDVDAALGLEEYNKLLIFKDSDYWMFEIDSNKPRLVSGYPRNIAEDFQGNLPNSVDAVFKWSDNGRVYVIKDDLYYRIRNIRVDANKLTASADRWFYAYPKSFSYFWDIDQPISDAMTYHDRTFFFTGRRYLRYNDNTYKADNTYPKDTAISWFGCQHPGLFEKPEMEMYAMERETQFEQIPTSIAPVQHASAVLIILLVFFL